MFRLAYNTNGLAHHRLSDALELLAELGYRGVAITPDVGQLDPFQLDAGVVSATRQRAVDLDLELAVETGARYLMDARKKHYPTLLEEALEQRARRVDFLRRSVDLAAELGAGIVSLWAGAAPDGSVADQKATDRADETLERLWERLVGGLRVVLDHARGSGVRVVFEPEPGMFIERPAGYSALKERLGAEASELGLCLDVGHLLCTKDLPVGAVIRSLGAEIRHIHLDDIANGVHEHRMFGDGDLDLEDTLKALIDIGYDGMAAVELSRDSHRGAQAAREALAHIHRALA